jgi:hypothetical protein
MGGRSLRAQESLGGEAGEKQWGRGDPSARISIRALLPRRARDDRPTDGWMEISALPTPLLECRTVNFVCHRRT